jgi:hypothetical protein
LTDLTPAVGRLLDPLADGDPEPLRLWLSGAGIDVTGIRELPQWNSDSEQPGARPQHRRLPVGFDAQVDARMDRAFAQAVRVPLGAALLCWYVRQAGEDAWKNSYHFDRIWATLRGAVRSWATHRALVADEGDRDAADASAVLLETLDWEIAVENEMVCANLDRLATAAQTVVDTASRAVTLAPLARRADPRLADLVAEQAAASYRCNFALAAAGRTLAGFLAGETGCGPERLDEAMALLAAAEGALECRDQRSELRAYRVSLASLRERAGAQWLRLDDVSVVHVYPFAVRGIPPAEAVSAVGAGGPDWDLAGVRSTATQAMELDDVWNGSDALGRRYDGAVIVLPDVFLTDLDGRPLGRLAAEVRLSGLGNHYLRLHADLRDATVHTLYGAMLRSAPEHGEVQVRCGESGQVWPRLSTFAIDLIEALGARLGGSAAVSVRPGMFHVLVNVLEASVGPGPAAPRAQRRPVTTTAQLLGAVGGQALQQPVPNIIGAPVEWIRYSAAPHDVRLAVMAREDEVIARTCNTTLLVALGSPAYWIGTRQTVAEFVASLDGLFAGWFDELATFLVRVMRQSAGASGDADVHALTRQAALVEREQMRLYEFAADARSTIDLIRSPALVASPLVARTLLALLDAAGFDRREAELVRNIDAVLDDRLRHFLDTLVRRRQEREAQVAQVRERRQRARVDTMLAVIAAVGMSGLGQIYQAGYDVRKLNAVWLIAVIGAVMVLVGAVTWLSGDARRAGRAAQAARASGGTPGARGESGSRRGGQREGRRVVKRQKRDTAGPVDPPQENLASRAVRPD